MAIAFISNTTAAGPNTFSSSSVDTSGANFIAIGLTENGAASVTISDSKSNTWSKNTEQSATAPDCVLYYTVNPTVGTGHTFTATGSSIYAVMSIAWFSGVATTTPLDQQNGSGGGGMTSPAQPGSITPTEDDELVLSALAWSSGFDITSVTGMTQIGETDFAGGNNYGGGLAYVIQTTAAAINPGWNYSGTMSGNLTQASFKKAAGGGGGGKPMYAYAQQ